IKIGNGLIPARTTTRIQYQLNLPAVPAVGLLYAPAQTGTTGGGLAAGDPIPGLGVGETFTVSTGSTTGVQTFTQGIEGTTVQDLIDWINGNANINATASLDGGDIQIVANDVQTGITV